MKFPEIWKRRAFRISGDRRYTFLTGRWSRTTKPVAMVLRFRQDRTRHIPSRVKTWSFKGGTHCSWSKIFLFQSWRASRNVYFLWSGGRVNLLPALKMAHLTHGDITELKRVIEMYSFSAGATLHFEPSITCYGWRGSRRRNYRTPFEFLVHFYAGISRSLFLLR